MAKRYGIGTVVALVFTLLVWSTTFAGLRASLAYFTPGHLVFLRWGIAALVLAGYGALTGMRVPARRDLPAILLAGLLGFGVYQIALAYGQSGLTAGTGGLLINLAPAFTTVLAAALRLERVTWRLWAGLGVSLAGVVLLGVARGGFGGSPGHAALVALAAASFAGYVIVSRPLLARYSPLEVTTYAICAGSLPFLIWAPGALLALPAVPAAGLLTLLYMAMLPAALSYVAWSRAVAVLPPSVAARGLYLVPVIGLAVAWAWLGEVPSVTAVAGGLVVIAGVLVASSKPRPVAMGTRPRTSDPDPAGSAAPGMTPSLGTRAA
ncbi:MAG: DMT family transporter [Anaerosomatales bacterium]|nr:DMT family transporter [Anaerosomatales bacterium]MDT8434325.1 DMT family transporter [Anaerosomatales bacterium]